MTTSLKSGFTLIELSIVLIIIGLLVGGVLVGNVLIKAAEIRHAISDLDKFTVAVNAFKLKYNCIPGDCINSTAFFNIPNGNGNGLIDQWPNESTYAPASLLAAQLLAKTFYDTVGTLYIKRDDRGFGYLYYGDLYSSLARSGVTISWFGDKSGGAIWNCGGVNSRTLSPNDTRAIDTKIDDALPKKGSFLAFDAAIVQIPECPGSPPLPTCVDIGGANLYQNSDALGCRTVYYLPGN